VRGPVLAPPCIRHLPLAIAGDLHGVPRRVLAPHLGAESGLPGGFPFFNQPLRRVCGLSTGFSMIFLRGTLRRLMADGTDDGLRSVVDMHMLDVHVLLALAPVTI
jgi:hypothetical protein